MAISSENVIKSGFISHLDGISGESRIAGKPYLKKQSQFLKGQNERKVFPYKVLWRFCRFENAKKQSQFIRVQCSP